MSRIKADKRCHVVIPIVDRPAHGGLTIDYKLTDEAITPYYERAIEQVEKIDKPSTESFFFDYCNHRYNNDPIQYDKFARLSRVRYSNNFVGIKLSIYV